MSSITCLACGIEMDPQHQLMRVCECGQEVCIGCWAGLILAEGVCPGCRLSITQRDVLLQPRQQPLQQLLQQPLQQQPLQQPLQQQPLQQLQQPRQQRVRSIPRKVQTAMGLRGRSITLAPNTARQLFDIQHRLGYRTPSLAIDWILMRVEKDLARLPAAATEQ